MNLQQRKNQANWKSIVVFICHNTHNFLHHKKHDRDWLSISQLLHPGEKEFQHGKLFILTVRLGSSCFGKLLSGHFEFAVTLLCWLAANMIDSKTETRRRAAPWGSGAEWVWRTAFSSDEFRDRMFATTAVCERSVVCYSTSFKMFFFFFKVYWYFYHSIALFIGLLYAHKCLSFHLTWSQPIVELKVWFFCCLLLHSLLWIYCGHPMLQAFLSFVTRSRCVYF